MTRECSCHCYHEEELAKRRKEEREASEQEKLELIDEAVWLDDYYCISLHGGYSTMYRGNSLEEVSKRAYAAEGSNNISRITLADDDCDDQDISNWYGMGGVKKHTTEDVLKCLNL